MKDQELPMPLPVGAWVELHEDVKMDSEKGRTSGILFEGTVEQHVPRTGLLTFEENDVQRAEFIDLLEESDGYEVLVSYE